MTGMENHNRRNAPSNPMVGFWISLSHFARCGGFGGVARSGGLVDFERL